MQITSTYMAHSDYSNSSILSLQENAWHSLAQQSFLCSDIKMWVQKHKTFLLCPVIPLWYWALNVYKLQAE